MSEHVHMIETRITRPDGTLLYREIIAEHMLRLSGDKLATTADGWISVNNEFVPPPWIYEIRWNGRDWAEADRRD